MTPASGSSTYARPDVVAYVAAVRARLDDLDPTEVEELTGGLAADLADLAAESDDPLAQRLGPPTAYADELRAAAGLPARGRVRRTGEVELLRSNVEELLGRLRSDSRWPPVEGFLRSIRPAWWVLRAVVAGWLLLRFFGGSFGFAALLLLVAFVVVSVELGRGRWRERRGLSPLVLAGNLLAAVLVLPFISAATTAGATSSGEGHRVYEGVSDAQGVTNAGRAVSNVFAFDEQGRPLTDVQLFDQDGRPLEVSPGSPAPGADQLQDPSRSLQLVPSTDSYGRPRYNVFPLGAAEVILGDGASGTSPTSLPPTPVPPPLVAVPPLAGAAPTDAASGTPTQSPSATPTDVPSATPTDAPTAAPTDEPTATPTIRPTDEPTAAPTAPPTTRPSSRPTTAPTSAVSRPGPTPNR